MGTNVGDLEWRWAT